jgi:AcrR family transcriptional regulator
MGTRDPETEKAVLEAAERLLAGQPRRATAGRLSAVELADEAGISKGRLYRDYNKEKKAFLDEVNRRRADPPPATAREQQLVGKIAALESDLADLRDRLTTADGYRERWEEAARAAFRIINVLEVEKLSYTDTLESQRATINRRDRTIERLKAQKAEMASRVRPEATVTRIPTTQDEVDEAGEPPRDENEDR